LGVSLDLSPTPPGFCGALVGPIANRVVGPLRRGLLAKIAMSAPREACRAMPADIATLQTIMVAAVAKVTFFMWVLQSLLP
jgi:hypothetical protein